MNDPERLRTEIERNLSGFERRATSRPDLKAASVTLCVVVAEGTPSLLVIRRATRVRAHAGQWALPGGRRDAGESAAAAALRELAEETGLVLDESAMLGVLDTYVTRSGYVMTPVVCWGGLGRDNYSGAESEVQQVHVVPLADLDVTPNLLTIPESDAPVIQLPFLGRYLHAPTAAIIHQFCRIALHGETVRVAHYEQPVFAWS